jgi:hypothetical protein
VLPEPDGAGYWRAHGAHYGRAHGVRDGRAHGASAAVASAPVGTGAAGWISLALAALHLAAAPWAGTLGPGGQVAYLAMLAVPAAVLAWAEGLATELRGAWSWRACAPTAAVIAVWVASRLVTDLGSPRTADVIDGWRAFLDTVRFVQERHNLFTDLFDPALPGISSTVVAFHGGPFFQAGLVPFSLRAVQAFQIATVALTAAGVGVLARVLVGAHVAPIAAAVFLFAPYTRFVTFFPGPFLAGPLYAVAIVLAALWAVRRHSAAGVAALGAAAGVALGYPSAVPLLALVVAWTLWCLRRSLRTLGVGIAVGVLSFAAMVVPALPQVLTPNRFGSHFRWDGAISVIDAGLIGQIPVADTPAAYEGVVQRPLDVVASALLAPFAHPRVAVRLWSDALFDPVGAILFAVGLVVCLRAAPTVRLARALLLTFLVVLAPAFVSPIDIANATYAAVLPVVVAVVAAVGFAAFPLDVSLRRRTAIAVVAIVLGGTLFFDVVTPRTVPASSFGTMFDVLDDAALPRVVAIGYSPRFVRPTKTLNTGPITAFVGRQPVGFLEWDDGPLPVAELAAERKDLLFWTHGYDRDVPVAAAVCAAWPAATLYEIRDRSGLGFVHAARIGGTPWEPRAPAERWRTRRCGEG